MYVYIEFSFILYIVYLIIVGGLMIIFIYFSRLISNEKLIFVSWLKLLFLVFLIVLFFYLVFYYNKFDCIKFNVIKIRDLRIKNLYEYKFINSGLLYIGYKGRILILSILFLLIILISVVKLCTIKYFSIRKFKYE